MLDSWTQSNKPEDVGERNGIIHFEAVSMNSPDIQSVIFPSKHTGDKGILIPEFLRGSDLKDTQPGRLAPPAPLGVDPSTYGQLRRNLP